MTIWRLMLAGLWAQRRQHVGTVLATSVAAAAITGSLLVGSSVRGSLSAISEERLGNVGTAVATQDRFFTTALADRLGQHLNVTAAAVISVRGVVSMPDGSARADAVQVLGVDDRFWQLAPDQSQPTWTDGQALLNEPLARQLRLSDKSDPGEQAVVLRLGELTVLPQGTPLSGTGDDGTLTSRLNIKAKPIGGRQFGRFSLQAEQTPPMTLFVPRSWLAEKLGITGRANLLLIDERVDADAVDSAIASEWTLDDGQLQWEQRKSESRLSTPRVFLPASVGDSLTGQGVLTYLANTISHEDRQTPYSMIAGLASGLAQEMGLEPIGPNQIAINAWLAEDLNAKTGDAISLAYYIIDQDQSLQEASATFTVSEIVPMQSPASDLTLTPDFPGMADAKSYRDWDAGPEIDLTRIRDKDEEYWDQFRATPKAFLSLQNAQKLWSNRFGNLTQIRFDNPASPRDTDTPSTLNTPTHEEIRNALNPKTFGLVAQPVNQWAQSAARGTVDFGQLFAGLSMFIIAAALILAGLLQVFSIEQRFEQLGTLLAVGWPARRVRLLLAGEGAVVAFMGCVLGIALGVVYTLAVLWALSSPWAGAVASAGLSYHGGPVTAALGGASAFVLSLCVLVYATSRAARRSVTKLLLADLSDDKPGPRRAKMWFVAGVTAIAAVVLMTLGPSETPEALAGRFFGGGVLLLVSLLAITRAELATQTHSGQTQNPSRSLMGMALNQMRRRSGRSLTVIGLIATSVFMVTAVSLFRLQDAANPKDRASGTGGFTLIAESSLPIPMNLNTPGGIDRAGLDADMLQGVSFVSVRVHGGDDASCLNLNLAPEPRLLGIHPEELHKRNAFTFADGEGWAALDRDLGPNIIPAIADQNTARWALKLGINDRLEYTNAQGDTFHIQLVGMLRGSVLQGSLMVADDRLREQYPSLAGQQMMLIDTPIDRIEELAKELSIGLTDYGTVVTSTLDRLSAFNQVQNTYLSMFQALGAIGMGLGSIGLGVVVLRNTLERRLEINCLRALGWTLGRIKHVIWLEHLALLAAGLCIGWLAALAAVLPSLTERGIGSIKMLGLVLLITASVSVLSIAAVIHARFRGGGNTPSTIRME